MSGRQYFKGGYYSTDYDEEGMGYWEYIDGSCTRHVVVLEDHIVLYRYEIGRYKNHMPNYHLEASTFREASKISATEFESMWARGVEFHSRD